MTWPAVADGSVVRLASSTSVASTRSNLAISRSRKASARSRRIRGALLGIPFQYAFSSMLVVGAGRDAAYVVERVAERVAATRPGGTIETATAT
jgi:hypothetical protein